MTPFDAYTQRRVFSLCIFIERVCAQVQEMLLIFACFPLTPVSANFVPSVIPALSYLLAYLILCTQAKLFRLPHSHAVRALQLLVSHVKAHYDHRYSTYIASIIRIMVSFLCTTVIRKEESCEIGCHTPRTPLIICQRLQ